MMIRVIDILNRADRNKYCKCKVAIIQNGLFGMNVARGGLFICAVFHTRLGHF